MSCDPWQERLQAYTDDNCTPAEASDLEAHLRACPSCAVEALALERMKQATRMHAARFTPSTEFQDQIAAMMREDAASKQELEPAVQEPARKEKAGTAGGRVIWPWRVPGWVPAFAGVAVVAVLIAVSAALWTRQALNRQALTELVDLHVATLASTNPVDVISTDRHTVKPWFAGKLPFTFNLPELQNSGYRLIGGKVVYLEGNPAAQLVYAVGKHEISVFVTEERFASTFREGVSEAREASRRDKGFTVERWSAAGLSYAMISDANSSDVRALGEMLRAAARP
jgi:anti-sigma factor RsiW